MTYLPDDTRRPITKNLQHNQQQRSPLGPRNSLDYWQKAEDRQGVTYFWNTATRPNYGMENIYAQQNTYRRPAPFPLSLPIGPPTPLKTASPTSTVIPIYHNVPSMPRARLTQQTNKVDSSSPTSTPGSQTLLNKRSTPPPRDSPPFSKPREENPIWSVPTNDSKFTTHPITVSPLYYRNNDAQQGKVNRPPRTGEKQRPNRQKPRWGRFMQSLCCCVSPQRENEKPPPTRPNPKHLITQVQKNGNGLNCAPIPDIRQNDYSTSPASNNNSNVIVPTSQISKPVERFLLPAIRPADVNKKCLIIDLDETLVHSSFKPVKNADFVIPVEIDGVEHKVYVLKRPYVDEFLARVGEKFECVLFTASLAKYADPVADLLDKRGVFRSRLFRDACVYHKGNYVKCLARLGRDLNKVLIIDNSPASYAFHPNNAIPVQTWFDDPTDVELLDILPLLDKLDKTESVYDILGPPDSSPSEPLLDRSSS